MTWKRSAMWTGGTLSSRADVSKAPSWAQDERGSVAFESVGVVLLLSILIVITLFLFQIVKTGASGPIDNRTSGRNAALNDICSPDGLIPGLPGTIGERDDSVIIISCRADVNGEQRIAEGDRFWASVRAAGEAHFSDFNRQQEGVGGINAVHSEQITFFNREFMVGDGVLARNLFFSNDTLTPSAETWRFNVQAWAEGHDKVVWEALDRPHHDLFPRVYPSALEPSSDPCARVDQHRTRLDNGGITGSLGNDDPFGLGGGGDDAEGWFGNLGLDIFDWGSSLFESSDGRDLGDAWECQRTKYLYFDAELSLVTNQVEIFDDFSIPLPGVQLEFEGGLFETEMITLTKDTDVLVTDTIDLGAIEGDVRLQPDDGGVEFEAEGGLSSGSIRKEICGAAGAGSSGCFGTDVSGPNLGGDLEFEVSPDGVEFEGSGQGALATVGADVTGTVDLRDIPGVGDAIADVITDTQISGSGRIEVGVGGGQIATPPSIGDGIDFNSTSGGITVGVEGDVTISNDALDAATQEATDAVRDVLGL